MLIKHNAPRGDKSGRSEPRYVALCEDWSAGGEIRLMWGDADRKKMSTTRRAKDVLGVEFGTDCTSPNFIGLEFERVIKCFSVLFNDRTVDFECQTDRDAIDWVCGLVSSMENSNGTSEGRVLWSRARMRLLECSRTSGTDAATVIRQIAMQARKLVDIESKTNYNTIVHK